MWEEDPTPPYRLTGVEPVFPTTADNKKIEFTYDYRGRRVRKQVVDWDPDLNGGEGGWSEAASLDRRRR